MNGTVWRAKREGPEFRTGCMRQGSLTYAKVLHCRQTRDVTTRPTHYPDPGYGAHAHCAHAAASVYIVSRAAATLTRAHTILCTV